MTFAQREDALRVIAEDVVPEVVTQCSCAVVVFVLAREFLTLQRAGFIRGYEIARVGGGFVVHSVDVG